MLATFVWLAYSIIVTLFFGGLDISKHDYIIVGGGPAGTLLARKLSDHIGVNVLLLEAGLGTQYSLAGTEAFGGPVTRFDIPLFWPTATAVEGFQWPPIALPSDSGPELGPATTPGVASHAIHLCRGLGGCGIHNAMIYVRALPHDLRSWNLSGWDWKAVVRHYISLENHVGGGAAAVAGLHRHLSEHAAGDGDVESGRQSENIGDGSSSGSGGRAVTDYYTAQHRSSQRLQRRRLSSLGLLKLPLIPSNPTNSPTTAGAEAARAAYHGYSGPITTDASHVHDPVSSLFMDAAMKAGRLS